MTYISTSATEKRKNKRQAQKENLEQVLVPYCTCLEKTVLKLNTIYQDPVKLYGQNAFAEWIVNLKKPLEYLESAKRMYLSKTMRQKLQDYKNAIENFDGVLERECTSCLIKYKHYISSKLYYQKM